MRMSHRALFVVVLVALVIGSMSVPRLEAGMPTTAAQGAGKARRARKRLAHAIRKKGLAERLDNVRICEDDPTINAAMQNMPSVCNFPL